MPDTTRTEISTLGEFGLIDHLTRNQEIKNASTVLGVGDDGAVIDHFGRQTVISTDLLVEGIHFDLSYTPLKHLGYKSVVINLSDIYAMNATPTQIVISIAFSNRFSLEALDEFYEGVYAACDKYGVDLVGGDTSTSQKGFVISITAIGEVAPDNYVKRSGAKANDLICVSGELGGAFLGLADDATAAYTNPAGLTILGASEVALEYRHTAYTTPFSSGGSFSVSPFDDTGLGSDNADSNDDALAFLSYTYAGDGWALAAYRHQPLAFDLAYTQEEIGVNNAAGNPVGSLPVKSTPVTVPVVSVVVSVVVWEVVCAISK